MELHRREEPGRLALFRRPALFVPGLVTVLIMTAGTSDAPFLEPLRTEFTYGWWVAVLYPAAAFLALAQVTIWIGWIVRRLARGAAGASPSSRDPG